MKVPDISVVMSVHNGDGDLPVTLDSILVQDGVDLELIVVDDGSTDQSGTVLQRYAEADERVVVIRQENAGLTRALCRACSIARGRFIARQDAGDVSVQGRLRKQVAALEAFPDAVLVSCWTGFYGPEWETLYVCKGNGPHMKVADVLPLRFGDNLLDGPTCHPSVMFRRDVYEAVGGYRWQFYYGQDWDLWYRLAERGGFLFVDEELYKARMFPDGVSAVNRERQALIGHCSLSAFWCRRQGLPEEEWLQKASRIRPGGPGKRSDGVLAGEGMHFVGELLRRRGDARCVRYFASALRQDCLRPNTWFRLIQACAAQAMARMGGWVCR